MALARLLETEADAAVFAAETAAITDLDGTCANMVNKTEAPVSHSCTTRHKTSNIQTHKESRISAQSREPSGA